MPCNRLQMTRKTSLSSPSLTRSISLSLSIYPSSFSTMEEGEECITRLSPWLPTAGNVPKRKHLKEPWQTQHNGIQQQFKEMALRWRMWQWRRWRVCRNDEGRTSCEENELRMEKRSWRMRAWMEIWQSSASPLYFLPGFGRKNFGHCRGGAHRAVCTIQTLPSNFSSQPNNGSPTLSLPFPSSPIPSTPIHFKQIEPKSLSKATCKYLRYFQEISYIYLFLKLANEDSRSPFKLHTWAHVQHLSHMRILYGIYWSFVLIYVWMNRSN